MDFKNKLEFWDRLKQKYDWENEDLDLGNGKVEEELVSQFTHIPSEIQECAWWHMFNLILVQWMHHRYLLCCI